MSLLPPILPPQVVARTRIRALSADFALQQDATQRAALAYEMGALTESRLGDSTQALDYYRDAAELDANFRPPLFALRRLLRDARDYDELVRVLAKIVNASSNPAERAAALVELGCLLEDQLADPAGAKGAFERALLADPGCLAGTLMLERSLLAQNHLAEAHALSVRRARHTLDPKLRAALACEAADGLAARGAIDTAIELLLSTLALPGRHLSTLLMLSQLARLHDRPAIAAHACEDLGAMLAAFASGQTGPDPMELATRYPDVASAARAAAFYYREAGRLYAKLDDGAADAVLAYERALACTRNDVLLLLEYGAVCEAADDLNGARASIRELLPHADARRAAALHFQLAELAEREGEPADALERLQAARALAPDAPVVSAVLEDRLLDAGDFATLSGVLDERARRLSGADRSCALLRAALSADRANDASRALALYDEAASVLADKTPVLRELYGAALRFAAVATLRDAGAKLLFCDLEPAERSAVMRASYESALAERDVPSAQTLLRAALQEPACQLWAAHSAWVVAASNADRDLLALAHGKLAELAERAEDGELAAAHLAAQSRALIRLGDDAQAVTRLRRALELVPTHAYAVALLEDCLLVRGEAGEAVQLLRDAASAERDTRRGESALLQAAVAAENAGRLDLARSSYDEAAERDPLAFAPLWARLRFAERSGDAALRLSALRALAARETALERPASAQLELAEALCARADFAFAVAPLAAALSNDATAFEAATTTALLPQRAAAGALRSRGLSFLAEHTSRPARQAFEHERVAELVHVAPADARTLLAAHPPSQTQDPSDALLTWLLCETEPERAHALEGLGALCQEPAGRAEFLLHAQRTRSCLGQTDDADALVAALGMFEEAPGTLAATLALDESLSATDDADTRVMSLTALLEHLPPAAADGARGALARALLEAGHANQAAQLAKQLVTADPNDLSAWEVLRMAARQTLDFERVVEACDKLAQAAAGSARALLLEEAAAVLHERMGRPDEAELRLRTALDTLPDRKPAFERLHDVLVERENLAGLIALLAKRIAVSSSALERIDLMYERARIVRAGGDRDSALMCANQLLALAPAHPGALGLCAEIHTSLENFAAAVSALRALAEAEISPGQRRLAREGAADFLDDKLRQPGAAYHELVPLLEGSSSDLALHVRMADLAQRGGLIQEAAEALTRAAAACRGSQRAMFERRAAKLLLEVLNQPEAARAAFGRALLADPTDCDAFEALHMSATSTPERLGVDAAFLESLWLALAREPAEPRHLRALARAGRVTGQPVLEQLGLFALVALGLATPDEAAAAAALRDKLPSLPRGVLNDSTFGLLSPLPSSSPITRFARVACDAWLHVRQDTPEQHGVDRRVRVAKRAMHPVREALRPWLAAFGLELLDLYVSASEPRALYPVQTQGPKQVWIAGRELRTPLSTHARLALAPLAAAARAGLLPVAYGELGEARDLLRAAVRVGRGTGPSSIEPRATQLFEQFDRKLSRGLRRELEEAASALADPDGTPALIVDATRTLCLRACLIACADLGVALESVFGRERDLEAVLGSKHGLDLLRFWVSADCVTLLRTLGMHA
jgi:Tfp pilus assembly protein PilF